MVALIRYQAAFRGSYNTWCIQFLACCFAKPEAYLQRCQTSVMELFSDRVNDFQLLKISQFYHTTLEKLHIIKVSIKNTDFLANEGKLYLAPCTKLTWLRTKIKERFYYLKSGKTLNKFRHLRYQKSFQFSAWNISENV